MTESVSAIASNVMTSSRIEVAVKQAPFIATLDPIETRAVWSPGNWRAKWVRSRSLSRPVTVAVPWTIPVNTFATRDCLRSLGVGLKRPVNCTDGGSRVWRNGPRDGKGLRIWKRICKLIDLKFDVFRFETTVVG